MDIKNLMRQAQQMQNQLRVKTDEFNKLDFTVETQGIKIKIMGNKKIKSITIEDELLKNKEDLEDLLVIAINNSYEKVQTENKKYLGPLMNNMPPGLI